MLLPQPRPSWRRRSVEFRRLRKTSFGFSRAFICFSLLITGAAHANDPKVPVGNDPGGVAIAIVSSGMDYVRPELAARLARDGEGEIMGFDFADGDRAPFDAAGEGTALAAAVVAEAPRARLAPLRISAVEPKALGRALAFVRQSPARVALVAGQSGGENERFNLLRRAAPQIGAALFVLPAGDADVNLGDAGPIDNVIVVTASDGAGAIATNANRGAKSADVAVPAATSALAAARVTALAARLLAIEPGLAGAALKRRLLSFAAPMPGLETRSGWIASPEKIP